MGSLAAPIAPTHPLTFWVIADTHYGALPWTKVRWPWLNDLLSLPPWRAVHVGDVIHGDAGRRDIELGLWNEDRPKIVAHNGIPVISVRGNHDCFTMSAGDFASLIGPLDGAEVVTWGGKPLWKFIWLSQRILPSDRTTVALEQDTYSFLAGELADCDSRRLPAIVLAHAAPYNTIVRTDVTDMNQPSSLDDAFAVQPRATLASVMGAHASPALTIGGHLHPTLAQDVVKWAVYGKHSAPAVCGFALIAQGRLTEPTPDVRPISVAIEPGIYNGNFWGFRVWKREHDTLKWTLLKSPSLPNYWTA